jgi:hypothetical protein
MKRKAPVAATHTYICQLVNGGERTITIPRGWKITFGNVLPYNKITSNPDGTNYETPQGWQSRIVFRVYEGNKDNLRAVWNDVVSFRCEEIHVVEPGKSKIEDTRSYLEIMEKAQSHRYP